ncbi:copper chaperone PCu(A)C [Pseudorhodobacter ferrugineus]|uniref:copper chaperone PCu(A)C n=1 Tax=Pseudorhodobacter ferrugineus TaxID=77008 RepID=UPI0003B369F9|nr:copper chaperone PCu(A)C [Pseudorhodobacter ferrugineus]
MTKTTLFAAASAAFLAIASAPMAFAADIIITDPYLRVSGAMATSGAAFMVIENHGADDRLIGAKSDIAERVELHTHLQDANGVMKMVHVEEGFAVAAGENHALQRGGEHVMFLGLKSVPAEGEKISLTLTFEKAGDVTVEVPLDNARAAEMGKAMDHSKMGHGKMKEGAGN